MTLITGKKLLKTQADFLRELADMIEEGDTVVKVQILPLTRYHLSGIPFSRSWEIGIELEEDPEAFRRKALTEQAQQSST